MEDLKNLYLIYINSILDSDEEYFEKGYDKFLPIGILLERSQKLREAKDFVLKKYKGKLECEIYLPTSGKLDNELHVNIEEEHQGYLESAFRDFVSIAGVPEIIYKGSNYEIAETVIRSYNKKLKKLPLGGLMGRIVVDQ